MVTKTPKRKMGRPPLPASKKRLPSVGFRPTPEIRKKLAKAADSSDRSLSQEIESRLEASFLVESFKYEEFGGEQLYWLMKSVTAMGRVTLEGMGGDLNDPLARFKAMEIMEVAFRTLKKNAAAGGPMPAVDDTKHLVAAFEARILNEGAARQTQKSTAKKTTKKTKKTKRTGK